MIFTNHISDKQLISRIYKEFLLLNNKKINNPISNRPRISIEISPKEICNWLIRCPAQLAIGEIKLKSQ